MGKKLDKLLLLMWKNVLIQWRHPIQSIVQIITPVLFSFLLVAIRSLVVPEPHGDTHYQPFENDLVLNKTFARAIAYSPRNPILEQIMNNAILGIYKKSKTKLKLIPCNDSAALEQYLMNELNMIMTVAGVQFSDSLINRTSLDLKTEVTFRFPAELRNGKGNWMTMLLYPIYQVPGPRSWMENAGGPPNYYTEGFLIMQQEISLSIINYFKPFQSNVSLYMQRFPYPKWIEDNLLTALQNVVGLIFMLSFVYTCISTVKIITTEKELQLKEAMKIMGLPNWLHWAAWFIKCFVMLFITIVIMVLLVKFQWYPHTENTVFTYSNPLVILLFLVFYISAVITFCFAISVFFSKATTAATVASIIWFLSYFPYSFMQRNYSSLSLNQKLFASLGVNTAMAFGFQLILMFEGTEEGIQWYNIWDTTSPDDNLTLGYLIIMLAIDTLIYLLIALYVEAIFPGSFGVPKVWYFPFTLSFWCKRSNVLEVEEEESLIIEENEFVEDGPSNVEVGIKIQHLGKSFSGHRLAVRDLSLNVYKDQITVLLGHNGAGKTSTMNMLTGMFPPSKGTAIIDGFDIRNSINKVRENLGFCPQFNILFDELTVKEHLYFYCRLKGFPRDKITQEIDYYISKLDLVVKTDSLASQLSGGMKRKLSIGVALCGGSKVVMCDEPTSGMDPAARKILCDLLQSQKKGRTILLTTHYMDEADLLGDRIAIMAKGNLQCYGTSFFLKKKYGAGYRLVMEKSTICDVQKITNLLQNYIPDIQVLSDVGSELSYRLSPEKSSIFQPMLENLESQSEHLGILGFGISLTTLEEVFTRFGSDEIEPNKDIPVPPSILPSNFSYALEESTNKSVFFNQLLAMLMKRSISILRSWVLLLIQNFIVVSFLIMAVILARRTNLLNNLPDMVITLNNYQNPVITFTEVGSNKYAGSYKDLIIRNEHTLLDWKDRNMSSMMINQTIENVTGVRKRFIAGATFDNNSITAWFSNQPFHASALSLQLIMNTFLQKEMSANYSIKMHNHPLPPQLDTRLKNLVRGNNFGFQIAFNLGFSMAFVSAFYIMFYIKERSCKSKLLQFVSGASVLPFWIASFICDVITFVFTSLLILFTLLIFQEDGFCGFWELARIFSVLLLLGYSMLPLMYVMSYLFDIPSTGFTRMSLVNIFLGITAMLVVQILAQPEINLENISNIMHWVLLLIPHYSFSTGVRDLFVVYSTQENCNVFIEKCVNFTIPGFPHLTPEQCKKKICQVVPKCCSTTTNYYDLEAPGIGRNVIFSLCVGTLLILLLLLIEHRVFEKIASAICKKKTPLISEKQLDEDVQDENDRVKNMLPMEIGSTALIMKNVTKFYKDYLAVDSICLGVNKSECFGLLGINGAGKTTTFKIMTGDIKMSFGDAWINGINLTSHMKKVYQCIGYCPQFDGLLDDLTCNETLIIFSMLRGMSFKAGKVVAKKLAIDLDFAKHLNKKVKELSGGNKRKLSTALALIGNPLVLFLDEPTSGMDPVTKRYIWNVLNRVRDSGKCIILTSHSMEECEALCTRSAIMVNGVFMCIGSTQHLKSKFSDGYTIIVKTKVTDLTYNLMAIENFVKDHFADAIIREKHHDLITFYIKDKTLPWSQMFGIMERAKSLLAIDDYSLGQCSLEQVFLSFTKYQREEYL
ncbi:hypothetical protein RN001_009416 [Aquatica leii]|uniref:ABC transporter domain-containing protein n=1 Tax=Aquatica leii TaxID=1421715 RepID=A0AAN7NZK9_9COLE|nr:hypothetical protein RN001_009416 [Aquatica leii]